MTNPQNTDKVVNSLKVLTKSAGDNLQHVEGFLSSSLTHWVRGMVKRRTTKTVGDIGNEDRKNDDSRDMAVLGGGSKIDDCDVLALVDEGSKGDGSNVLTAAGEGIKGDDSDAEIIECLFIDMDNLKLSDNMSECEQEFAALKDTKPATTKNQCIRPKLQSHEGSDTMSSSISSEVFHNK
jgi:hypothetical protein